MGARRAFSKRVQLAGHGQVGGGEARVFHV